ncbi:unnamed protein product [Darwinula stevensoni]|uniref:Uncharacterized protein n=1 Tax=Darwinula stevensoni TaxID=69355 RepID=A0A7R9A6N2_9CRUS|nr:unnamed protein product [Darwinula stevensoni]CAG0895135.1 unnamed protein product [Darwinula stevensoni]
MEVMDYDVFHAIYTTPSLNYGQAWTEGLSRLYSGSMLDRISEERTTTAACLQTGTALARGGNRDQGCFSGQPEKDPPPPSPSVNGNGGGYGQYEFKIRVDDNGDSKKMVIIRQIELEESRKRMVGISSYYPFLISKQVIMENIAVRLIFRLASLFFEAFLYTYDDPPIYRIVEIFGFVVHWVAASIIDLFVMGLVTVWMMVMKPPTYVVGEDACEGKLNCDDGRCMPPDLCCFPQISPNCSSWNNAPCCAQLVNGYSASDARYQLDHDLNALQSTVLTTIGCVLALVFVVLCSIIGVCRINMRRSIMKYTSRHVRSYLNQHEHHHLSHPDVGLHLNPNTQSTFGNIIVTYNINNGVQLRGPAVNPPAYSEVVRLPLQDIPPPPYVSVEDVRHDPQAAQLLLEENNNGDINGNSVMSVEENNNHVMDRNHTSNIA